MQENGTQNVVCKMAAILARPQYVNTFDDISIQHIISIAEPCTVVEDTIILNIFQVIASLCYAVAPDQRQAIT